MIPEPKVRKVAPTCRCGSSNELIFGDGPPVCKPCIWEGGVMADATVRRNDTPDRRRRTPSSRNWDHFNREGQWR